MAPEGLLAIRELTERLDRSEHSGSVLGIALVVYDSTRLFRALRRALNQPWGIDLEGIEAARGRVARYGLRYGGAMMLTLFVALLVALLLMVKAGFAVLAIWSTRAPPVTLWTLDGVTSVALAFVLFCALFRFLPEAEVSWRDAGTSAAVSTALFAVGSGLVTLYVRHNAHERSLRGCERGRARGHVGLRLDAGVLPRASVGAALRQRRRDARAER